MDAEDRVLTELEVEQQAAEVPILRNVRHAPLAPFARTQRGDRHTGEGNLAVDITFESMDDFSPTAVARKVGAVAKLLEARTQLANLDTYMDGKAGAENLIAQALKDPALLQSLVSAPKPADDTNKDGE